MILPLARTANFYSFLLVLLLGGAFNVHAAGRNQSAGNLDGCGTAATDQKRMEYAHGLRELQQLLPAGKIGISLRDENFGLMPFWGKLTAEYEGSDFAVFYNRLGMKEARLTNLNQDWERGQEFRKTQVQFYEGPNSLILTIITDEKRALSWGPGFTFSERKIEAQFIRNADGSLKEIKVGFDNEVSGHTEEPGAFPLRVDTGWGPGNNDVVIPN